MPIAALHDDDHLRSVLAPWVADRLDRPGVTIAGLSRPGVGASNETVIAELEQPDGRSERLVFRVQPDGHQLFLRNDAILEGHVIQAVGRVSGAPVPAVVALEPDAAVIGSPFFVMEYVDGRVVQDIPSCHAAGWLLDTSPEERAAMWDHALSAMAMVCRTEAEEAFDMLWTPAAGTTSLEQLIADQRRSFDWMRKDRELGVLTRAVQFLETQRPTGGHSADHACNWGDARMGNIIFRPDGTVAALLDWEMASIGPPDVDIAWWLMMEEFYSFRLGATPLPGVPGEAAQLARWEELMGRRAEDIEYYKILAAFRFAVIICRSIDLSIDKGLVQAETTMHTRNPVVQMLCSWMGEDEPELAPEYAAMMQHYEEGNV